MTQPAPLPGGFKLPNPDEVNELHRYDDLDTGPTAHHHTLGLDPQQSSPGDHSHDGATSPKLPGYSTTTHTHTPLSRSVKVIGSQVDQTVIGGATTILAAHTLVAPASGCFRVSGYVGLEIKFAGGIADLYLDYTIPTVGNWRLHAGYYDAANRFEPIPVAGLITGLTPGQSYTTGVLSLSMSSQSVRYAGNGRGAAPESVALMFVPEPS